MKVNIVDLVFEDIRLKARREGKRTRAAEGVFRVQLNANQACTDSHPLALVTTRAGQRFVRHEDLTYKETRLGVRDRLPGKA